MRGENFRGRMVNFRAGRWGSRSVRAAALPSQAGMAPYSAWCAALRQLAGDGRHVPVVPGVPWLQTAPRVDAAVSGAAVPGGSAWFVGQQVSCGENRRIGLHVLTRNEPHGFTFCTFCHGLLGGRETVSFIMNHLYR